MSKSYHIPAPYALGALRANWQIVGDELVLRISGRSKQRNGQKAIEITQYEADSLYKWLLNHAPYSYEVRQRG